MNMNVIEGFQINYDSYFRYLPKHFFETVNEELQNFAIYQW